MARISRGYSLGSPLENIFPEPVISSRTPTTGDVNFPLGQVWVDSAAGASYILNQLSGGTATWTLMSPGASDVDTLTGDAGGAISPAGGNITLAGGTNVTSTGAVNTISFALDAAITLATSVSSPIYTSTGAIDTNINAVAGQDIIMKMGDAAAANKVSFVDSASAEVFAIDSNGGITTLTGLTIAGAFTQTAGVVSLSEDNAANAVGIANGTVARAITIGSSAAAHTITMGSATGAASLDLLAGTGNFTLEGATATTYDISSTGVNTGTVRVASGTGARIVEIAGGGTGAKTINIGQAASADLITIGDTTGAGRLTLRCGTGNFTLEGNIASTYQISNVGVNTGQVDIAGGTGARAINIGAGGTGAKTIGIGAAASADLITIGDATGAGSLDLACGTGNFTLEGNIATTYAISNVGINTGQVDIAGGTGARAINIGAGGTGAKTIGIGAAASADVITIGDATGAGSLDLVCGTGNFTLEGNIASTYDISSTGVNTGTVRVASGTGARIVEIGGGGTGAKTINIGAAASADLITIGDATGAGSLDLVCGTGNFSLEGNVASTYAISGAGVNTGLITIGGGTGAQTLNVMNATGVKTVNIASGAAANVVTLGSTNGAASLTLQSGTGEITVTGTVKEITSEFTTRSGDSITFTQSPLIGTTANTGGVATGVTSNVNLLSFQEGIIMEQFVIGAGQAIIKPVMTATGLLISGDETTLEGYEYNYGAVRANSRHSFTIGTSPAFFMEMSFRADDVSGLDPALFGFRITQANQTQGNLALYTDFVGYGLVDAVAGGDAVIQTQLNTGGVNSTDTNDAWADAATHTLAILVSAAGVVTFTFDGGAPTATQAYTFDNGDVVHPFWRHEFNAALPDAIEWLSQKIGFQA